MNYSLLSLSMSTGSKSNPTSRQKYIPTTNLLLIYTNDLWIKYFQITSCCELICYIN